MLLWFTPLFLRIIYFGMIGGGEGIIGISWHVCYTTKIESFSRGVTQFIVTTDCDAEEYEQLRQQMALVAETIQTTAVYCEGYRWLELFPHGVHKGNAVATLSSSLTISHANVYVVGNDYNDLSMLQHFSNAFLMGNAPESLKGNFALVSSHDEDGVAEVVQLLIESGMGREM